jgi:hypothetical protein
MAGPQQERNAEEKAEAVHREPGRLMQRERRSENGGSRDPPVPHPRADHVRLWVVLDRTEAGNTSMSACSETTKPGGSRD